VAQCCHHMILLCQFTRWQLSLHNAHVSLILPAPNLKGRPRRKRLAYKKDWSPGDSDSNDSVERTATEVTRPGSIQTSFRPNSNGILSGHRKNSDTPSNVVVSIWIVGEILFMRQKTMFVRRLIGS